MKRLSIPSIFFILAVIKYFRYLPTSLFDADQEYLALSAQSILGGKLTLLGAPTSVGGMFIGPLYNYLIAFFLWLFRGSPFVINGLSFFWAVLAIPAIYITTTRLANKTAAIFAAFFALISIGFIDQSGTPPLCFPLPLITILFIATAASRRTKSQKSFILGILAGLALNLHFSGIFFLPLLFFFGWQWLIPLLILTFPLIFFEFRHQFFITRNAIDFLTQNAATAQTQLLNRINAFINPLPGLANLMISQKLSLLLILTSLAYSFKYKKFSQSLIITATAFFFFFIYSGCLLPYYSIIVWPVIFISLGLFLSRIWKLNGLLLKIAILLLITRMAIVNLLIWKNWSSSRSIDHKIAILKYIKIQAGNQPYYISRTMDPATNFGFDYLISWIKLNPTYSPEDPTYTIIAPFDFQHIQSDLYFGDFGLILPK